MKIKLSELTKKEINILIKKIKKNIKKCVILEEKAEELEQLYKIYKYLHDKKNMKKIAKKIDKNYQMIFCE